MDINDVVESAKAAVERRAVTDEKAVEVTEDVSSWLERMTTEQPEEVVDPTLFGEMTKVPGYDRLTLGICALYDVRYSALAYLQELKNSGEVFEPHILTTAQGLHIIRGFSRREWASIQRRIIDETETRMEAHANEGSKRQWVDADLQMCTEESIVIAGTVQPRYDRDTVRSVPTGLVTYLSNSILRASGHDEQQLPPIPLK